LRINPRPSRTDTSPSHASRNGLVFRAKAFVRVARRYGVSQEYITPYSPEQNGMIEHFFKTPKEECVWLHRFRDRDHAFAVIAAWLERYDAARPHSAASPRRSTERNYNSRVM